MKLLHTSDWHLGHLLNGTFKRNKEFASLFDWLLDLVESEGVDLFLIAGDVFDSPNPPIDAVTQYYDFISKLSETDCRHLVVVGGNHDSGARLDAPGGVLELIDGLNVHVVGSINPEDPLREVLVLRDVRNNPEAVVCAIPYIPDRFLRTAEFGESWKDRTAKMLDGLKEHYHTVCAAAEQERDRIKVETGKEVPLIVTGHLFTKGSETKCTGDDGVRNLTLGGLYGSGLDIFPPSASYVALGHIHSPHAVGNRKHIRYSGSILPIGFDETVYPKKLCLVDFDGAAAQVKEVEVPGFRPMKRVLSDDVEEVYRQIDAMNQEIGEEDGYFKVSYTGEYVHGLYDEIVRRTEGTRLHCCGVQQKNFRPASGMNATHEGESVKDLSEYDVFDRLLASKKIPEEERGMLVRLFTEAVNSVKEKDDGIESGKEPTR